MAIEDLIKDNKELMASTIPELDGGGALGVCAVRWLYSQAREQFRLFFRSHCSRLGEMAVAAERFGSDVGVVRDEIRRVDARGGSIEEEYCCHTTSGGDEPGYTPEQTDDPQSTGNTCAAIEAVCARYSGFRSL